MRQKLGQHFLKNLSVIDRTIATLDIQTGDRIIEIGPGKGALTIPLKEECLLKGAFLTAIERDAELISELLEKNIEVIHGDALETLPEMLKKPAKVVGNIPYYISGKLFRILSEAETKPRLTILMVQREVAERACSMPPHMNRLAASVQFWAGTDIITFVSKKDFSPPPEVDSAVIRLVAKENSELDPELYYKTVRALFQQPRKTITNNLSALEEDRNILTQMLQTAKIDGGLRPQDLDIKQICDLASLLA